MSYKPSSITGEPLYESRTHPTMKKAVKGAGTTLLALAIAAGSAFGIGEISESLVNEKISKGIGGIEITAPRVGPDYTLTISPRGVTATVRRFSDSVYIRDSDCDRKADFCQIGMGPEIPRSQLPEDIQKGLDAKLAEMWRGARGVYGELVPYSGVPQSKEAVSELYNQLAEYLKSEEQASLFESIREELD